jgi:hypothetical protein
MDGATMTGIRPFHVPFAFHNCASFKPVDLLDRHQAYPGIPLCRVIPGHLNHPVWQKWLCLDLCDSKSPFAVLGLQRRYRQNIPNGGGVELQTSDAMHISIGL